MFMLYLQQPSMATITSVPEWHNARQSRSFGIEFVYYSVMALNFV